jgi:hypothetical protein
VKACSPPSSSSTGSAPTTCGSASSADHPLVEVVRRFLKPGDGEAYVELLRRRLATIEQGVMPSTSAGERRLARAFLRPREGTWHDGDENLVRGWLDAFGHQDPDVDVQAILTAAGELSRIRPRAETVWYFLWAMESMLADRD